MRSRERRSSGRRNAGRREVIQAIADEIASLTYFSLLGEQENERRRTNLRKNMLELSRGTGEFGAAKKLGWTPQKLLEFLKELGRHWSVGGLVIQADPHRDYHLMTRWYGERLADVEETRFLNLCNPMRSAKTLAEAAEYNGVHEATHKSFMYNDYQKFDEEVLVHSITAKELGGRRLGNYLSFARETIDHLKPGFKQEVARNYPSQDWLARIAHWQAVLEGHARQQGLRKRHAQGFQKLAKTCWKLVSEKIGPGTEFQSRPIALPKMAFSQYQSYLERYRFIYAQRTIQRG